MHTGASLVRLPGKAFSHQKVWVCNGGACSLVPLPGAAVPACGSTWAASTLRGCSPGCRPTPAPGAERTAGSVGKGKAELSPGCRGHPRGSPSRDENPRGRRVAPSAREPRPRQQRRRRRAKSGKLKDDGHGSTRSCLLHKSPRVFAFPPVAARSSRPPDTPGRPGPLGSNPALPGKGPVSHSGSASGLGSLSIPEDGPSPQTPPAPRPCLPHCRLCRISRQEQGEALAAALADTLWAAGGDGRAVVCLVTAAVRVTPSRDYKADNFTERVSTKTPSANRILFKDMFGLKFLKASNVKSHKPLP